jgi:ATP-dependent DNA ligase
MPRIGIHLPPMKPSYATFEETMAAHDDRTFADIKYDGYRVEIHKKSGLLRIFTANGNELNYDCYPEIVKTAQSLPTCIIEAELVGDGKTHKEVFDNVKRRFRRSGISDDAVDKYLSSGVVENVPLSLRVFDVLRFEGQAVMYLPLEERRKFVERFDGRGIRPGETQVITSTDYLVDVVESTFRGMHEGRVCKNPASLYVPGSRTLDWVKFKRSETLDLVVVGFYNEEYAGDLPFTSVLVAAYNDETGNYETLGKVGATRGRVADEIFAEIGGKVTGSAPQNVILSDKLRRQAYSMFVPAGYIDPESSVVLEVKAMNVDYSSNWQSCGLKDGKAFSMRIGYACQLRPDKSPRQATTTETVRRLYALQKRVGA